MPEIRLVSSVDSARVSAFSRLVLERILVASGNPTCLVTRATATPEDQARVMYENLVRHGVEAQRRLYLAPGRKVVEVFAQASIGTPRADVIASMAAAIREVGPEKVSRHCADPAVLQVLDVAPSSLAHPERFRAAAKADRAVSKVLGPPSDPALHLEIPQPAARAPAPLA